ncbi:hypothetical protein BMF94_3775 [Rhodotorula taiwanensis]|uniref:Uncharacterized protein n=1 Tax=Rhodotorula taiwanensis TaxID=741276 RepID=A0A2S5B9I9_9BASI|nr:hypothetical protein BMF94_3775 [Rhodotorula taiwanensis]
MNPGGEPPQRKLDERSVIVRRRDSTSLSRLPDIETWPKSLARSACSKSSKREKRGSATGRARTDSPRATRWRCAAGTGPSSVPATRSTRTGSTRSRSRAETATRTSRPRSRSRQRSTCRASTRPTAKSTSRNSASSTTGSTTTPSRPSSSNSGGTWRRPTTGNCRNPSRAPTSSERPLRSRAPRHSTCTVKTPHRLRGYRSESFPSAAFFSPFPRSTCHLQSPCRIDRVNQTSSHVYKLPE